MMQPVSQGNSAMVKPQDVLPKSDYRNYRNVRAVATLFVLLGSVFVLGGLVVLFNPPPGNDRLLAQIWGAVAVVLGGSGIWGGRATLRGDPRRAPWIYLMAAFYVLVFPLGTLFSLVLFLGLSRYLKSMQQLRAASAT